MLLTPKRALAPVGGEPESDPEVTPVSHTALMARPRSASRANTQPVRPDRADTPKRTIPEAATGPRWLGPRAAKVSAATLPIPIQRRVAPAGHPVADTNPPWFWRMSIWRNSH